MRESLVYERLSDALAVRNRLTGCKDIRAVASEAVALIRDRLQSQAASVFLFNKRGVLERLSIAGVDAAGEAILDTWFPEEAYRPGESFTGRAVLPSAGTKFGSPQLSNCVDQTELNPRAKQFYEEKLGRLHCAIAVPLNGRHRSFGVIEVLNRYGGDSQHSRLEGFSSDDLFWLSLIANNVAHTISYLRKQQELILLDRLSDFLAEPFGTDLSREEVLNAIASTLTSDSTCYLGVIVRAESPVPQAGVTARAGALLSWSDWIETPIGDATTINGGVLRSGEPVFVPDVQASSVRFRNSRWVKANDLRGYACLPLFVKERTVGTLSVFTGFRHSFDSSSRAFLSNVADLIASISEAYHVMRELRQAREQLDEQNDKLIGIARAASHVAAVQEILHQYKNELLDIQRELKSAVAAGAARSERILQHQIQWIDARLQILTSELTIQNVPTDINRIVHDVLTYFKSNQQGMRREARIEFIPELDRSLPMIYGGERELTDLFHNLISNAVKAVRLKGGKGGRIIVRSEVIEERRISYVQIAVEDNGIGIRSEYVERIMEPGFSTYEGGTGMGLHYARKTVEQIYGGKLLVLTTSIGKGTRIAVRIPLRRHAVG